MHPTRKIHFNDPNPHHGKAVPAIRVFTTTGDDTSFSVSPRLSTAVFVVKIYGQTTMHCGSHLAALRSFIKTTAFIIVHRTNWNHCKPKQAILSRQG